MSLVWVGGDRVCACEEGRLKSGSDGLFRLTCFFLFHILKKLITSCIDSLNANSSRSHEVLMLKIERREKKQVQSPESQQGDGKNLFSSILYLVDLAGSERVKKSRSTGDRLDEAKAINSSLSVLGKCIHALSESRPQFVPFRDSKLTRLLQDSLGGNCKTVLIVTIGPYIKHIDETISSLNFGMRAMKVQNKPKVNKQKDYFVTPSPLLALSESSASRQSLSVFECSPQRPLAATANAPHRCALAENYR